MPVAFKNVEQLCFVSSIVLRIDLQFDEDNPLHNQIGIVISHDDVFILHLRPFFDFCARSALDQFHLERALVTRSRNP